MITIFAIDALEYSKVQEYGCENLKQKFYGKTDITEFSQPRTIVLWSSFMTGENKEEGILAKGDKEMWNIRIPTSETFFSKFENPVILDLPGYNYDLEVHEKSRELLKRFFEVKTEEEKEGIKAEYNKDAFAHHKEIKELFIKELSAGHDLVLGYFSVADVVGHLNFGNGMMMKMIYKDLDDMMLKINQDSDKVLVISDHGMKALGRFGDHSDYGFWSVNFGESLGNPRITEFYDIVVGAR